MLIIQPSLTLTLTLTTAAISTWNERLRPEAQVNFLSSAQRQRKAGAPAPRSAVVHQQSLLHPRRPAARPHACPSSEQNECHPAQAARGAPPARRTSAHEHLAQNWTLPPARTTPSSSAQHVAAQKMQSATVPKRRRRTCARWLASARILQHDTRQKTKQNKQRHLPSRHKA